MYLEIKQSLRFFIHPSVFKIHNNVFINIRNTIFVWAFYSGYVFLAGILTQVLLYLFSYDIANNKIVQTTALSNVWFILISAVIIAPIFEEISFRLLFSHKKVLFLVGSTMLIAFSLFVKFDVDNSITILKNNIPLALSLLAAYVGFIYLLLKHINLENFWASHIGKVSFHLMIWVFALVHIFNFENLNIPLYIYPLIVLPQLILSYVLAFVRTRYGIFYSMLFHFLHNFLSIFMLVILMFGNVDVLNSNALPPYLILFICIYILFLVGVFLFANIYILIKYLNRKSIV